MSSMKGRMSEEKLFSLYFLRTLSKSASPVWWVICKSSFCSERDCRASTIAIFIEWEPWLPPRTKTRNGPSVLGRAFSFGWQNSSRIMFPVTSTFSFGKDSDDSLNETAILSAIFPNHLFVIPDIEFCS